MQIRLLISNIIYAKIAFLGHISSVIMFQDRFVYVASAVWIGSFYDFFSYFCLQKYIVS